MSLAPVPLSAVVGDILAEVKSNYWADNVDVNMFGPSDDAANAAPRSIYWMPIKENTWEASRLQGKPGSPGTLWVRPIEMSFLIFGGDASEPDWVSDADTPAQAATRAGQHETDETESLLAGVINAIQRKLGANGYENPSVTWFPSGRDGIGMSCELTITLKIPLLREDNPTFTATGIDPITVTIAVHE